jgi:23S rRNA (pseudouridine1915-N3)-methyltransferase
MHLQLLAVGRLKPGPERDLAERYRERAAQSGRSLGFSGPDIAEFSESRARRPEDRKAEEGEEFAALLATARDSGRANASFIIGGADGLDPALRSGAGHVLSFGAMTVPHQLVRVLVLEQLYRAMTILAGHPYHRV